MPNAKRIDEITAHIKEILDGDARLDDNLLGTPVVYDSMPKPENEASMYRVYLDPMPGWRLYDTQVKTAMTFLTLEHTVWIWLVVYNDVQETAQGDYWKLQDNIVSILADKIHVAEGGYWDVGLPGRVVPSARHENLDTAGDVGFRVGYVEFNLIQDKLL